MDFNISTIWAKCWNEALAKQVTKMFIRKWSSSPKWFCVNKRFKISWPFDKNILRNVWCIGVDVKTTPTLTSLTERTGQIIETRKRKRRSRQKTFFCVDYRRRCRRRRIYIITLLRGYRVAKRGHHNEHRKQKVLKNCFAVDLNFVRT